MVMITGSNDRFLFFFNVMHTRHEATEIIFNIMHAKTNAERNETLPIAIFFDENGNFSGNAWYKKLAKISIIIIAVQSYSETLYIGSV